MWWLKLAHEFTYRQGDALIEEKLRPPSIQVDRVISEVVGEERRKESRSNPSARFQIGLLMNKKKITRKTKKKTSKIKHKHDWAWWGDYDYLGPGTPFTAKAQAGVEPKNWIDMMAYGHDHYYSESADMLPGARSVMRGGADIVFGLGMVGSGFSPWSDLTFGERLLALGAGGALVGQGGFRAHPLTALPMAIVDWVKY